jgi:hypothetical protein
MAVEMVAVAWKAPDSFSFTFRSNVRETFRDNAVSHWQAAASEPCTLRKTFWGP